MSELKINQRQLNGQLSDSEYNKSETAHEVFNTNIYLLHNDNVYKIPIKDITNTSKVVFSNYKILAHLSENHKYGNDYHYYLFDWEDDDLYIIYCPEADDNFIVTHIKTDN